MEPLGFRMSEEADNEIPCDPSEHEIDTNYLQACHGASLLSPSIQGCDAFAGRETSSQSTSDDAQEHLSDLQNKLEVSCQWAFDLESDLETACALVRESDDRCRVLECALSERDLDLERAQTEADNLRIRLHELSCQLTTQASFTSASTFDATLPPAVPYSATTTSSVSPASLSPPPALHSKVHYQVPTAGAMHLPYLHPLLSSSTAPLSARSGAHTATAPHVSRSAAQTPYTSPGAAFATVASAPAAAPASKRRLQFGGPSLPQLHQVSTRAATAPVNMLPRCPTSQHYGPASASPSSPPMSLPARPTALQKASSPPLRSWLSRPDRWSDSGLLHCAPMSATTLRISGNHSVHVLRRDPASQSSPGHVLPTPPVTAPRVSTSAMDLVPLGASLPNAQGHSVSRATERP